jgi:hypothetical protein
LINSVFLFSPWESIFLQDKLKLFIIQLIELYSTVFWGLSWDKFVFLFVLIDNRGIFLLEFKLRVEGKGTALKKLIGDFK